MKLLSICKIAATHSMEPVALMQWPVKDFEVFMGGKSLPLRLSAIDQLAISSLSAEVPVRWPQIKSISRGWIPDLWIVVSMQVLTPADEGAVIEPPFRCPPLLTKPLTTSPYIMALRFIAVSSSSKIKAPAPLPGTNPALSILIGLLAAVGLSL